MIIKIKMGNKGEKFLKPKSEEMSVANKRPQRGNIRAIITSKNVFLCI